MKTQKITGWLAVGVALLGALPATAQTLEAKTKDALVAALDDERKAQAIYGAVMAKFGQVRPFVNIIRAERNHEAQLLGLFKTYQLTVPENQYTKKYCTLETSFCRYSCGADTENILRDETLQSMIKVARIKMTRQRQQKTTQESQPQLENTPTNTTMLLSTASTKNERTMR